MKHVPLLPLALALALAACDRPSPPAERAEAAADSALYWQGVQQGRAEAARVAATERAAAERTYRAVLARYRAHQRTQDIAPPPAETDSVADIPPGALAVDHRLRQLAACDDALSACDAALTAARTERLALESAVAAADTEAAFWQESAAAYEGAYNAATARLARARSPVGTLWAGVALSPDGLRPAVGVVFQGAKLPLLPLRLSVGAAYLPR